MSYQEGSGVTQSYTKANELYAHACKNGDSDACGNLGVNYAQGNGFEKDDEKALALYKKACEGGAEFACDNLEGADSNPLKKIIDLFK